MSVELKDKKKKKRDVASADVVLGEAVNEKSETKKKEKRKSVQFSVPEPETESFPKKKKAKKSDIIREDDANDGKQVEEEEKIGKKRSRRVTRKRKNMKFKKQRLFDGAIGPSVEQMKFDCEEQKQFKDFDLDERILKGVGEMGWKVPTQVQESVISLALEDRNIMARARTGSGKTAAFLLPILNKVIAHSEICNDPGPYAVFIAPTKELATQIHTLLVKLLAPFPFLDALNLSELAENERSVWENDTPALVVSTPGKLLDMLNIRSDFLKRVRHTVLDEADLLLSFGYETEMIKIKEKLPESYQCIFTSATLTDDMTALKKIFMTGPVVTIKLKEGDLPGVDQLAQYHITCRDETERFTIVVAMFKLRLLVGRTIVFVNTTDRCYKLSLVLHAFSINACILNSSMPANSRCHIIDQYNKGYYDVVIASDASDVTGSSDSVENGEAREEKTGEDDTDEKKKQPKKGRSRKDKEAGVSRGIDFHHVANVINFDFPKTTDSYIHRVGRTARGWNKGTALSFCTPEEKCYLDIVQHEVNTQMGRTVLLPYEIRTSELDAFLVRTRDALFKCTPGAIKAARMKEIKLEMLRSQKLQAYFASNPRERILMETSAQPVTLKMHGNSLADVPDYIVPKALRGTDFSIKKKTGRIGGGNLGVKQRRKKEVKSKNQRRFKKKSKDPLQNFTI